MGGSHQGVWGRPGRGSGSDCGGWPAQLRGSAAEWGLGLVPGPLAWVEAPSLLGHAPPHLPAQRVN